jgi:hypothetical protein
MWDRRFPFQYGAFGLARQQITVRYRTSSTRSAALPKMDEFRTGVNCKSIDFKFSAIAPSICINVQIHTL